MELKYVILDFETGGLSAKRNPITEVAVLAIDSSYKEISHFETFVKPYNNLKLEAIAMEKTGITMTQLNSGLDIFKTVNTLADFFKSLIPTGDRGKNKPMLVGHNIIFDIAFLKEAFSFCKKDIRDYLNSSDDCELQYIDTLPLSRMKWDDKGGRFTLEACCKRIKHPFEDAHRAMNDVRATKKLFQYLTTELKNEAKIIEKKGKKEVFIEQEDETDLVTEHRQSFEI